MNDKEPVPAPNDERQDASQPKRLGGFELLGRLGKGGMGTVLKARQVSMDRLIALKILPRKLAENEEYVQRFLREARSAARLRHPNIVQAHDVGFVDGYYFFAMEFVDGETLEAVLRREGPLEPNRALAIMRQVCSALAAAHKEGVVHRDIKPANIMLDREGEVRVTDFGLARRLEGDVVVTADGQALGTPTYLSPEMAKGGEADARSDLYSLGATFFHILAGRPPFEGRSLPELIVKHVNEPAPPLATLAPHVDRRLCHIIDRLLRKNPDARYPSANALLDDLEGLGTLQPVAAAAPRPGGAPAAPGAPTLAMSEGQRAHREAHPHAPPRRSRAPLVAAGVAVAVAAAIAVVVATRGSKTPPASPAGEEGKAAKAAREARKPAIVFDDSAAKEKARLEEQARAEKQLDADLALLRNECNALAAKDQFGKALELADAFAAKHASDRGAAEAQKLKEELKGKADARYADIYLAAESALKQKDYAKARAALGAAEAFGTPEHAQRAAEKLKEVASREKSAAEWAKWDAIKAEARKLADAGEYDEAAKHLETGKGLAIENIADLIAEETGAIEAARRKAAQAAMAAYAKESDRVWALFKERKYPEADKLLAELAAKPELHPAAQHLAADQGAAKVLNEFWAAVEKGVAARKGTVSIEGAIGNITGVEKGVITIQTPKGTETRTAQQLKPEQALAYAALALKDGERSKLAEAIFRIAEAEEPKLAEQALAAAGKPPGLTFYQERLAILALGAQEAAAQKAWRDIEGFAKEKLTKAEIAALAEMLAAFEKEHSNSKVAKEEAKEIAALKERIQKALAAAPAEADEGEELPAKPTPGKWYSLFDGKTLKGWQTVVAHDGRRYRGVNTQARVEDGSLIIQAPVNQALYAGINWTGPFPTTNYEVSLEVRRNEWWPSLCHIIFPVGHSHCELTTEGAKGNWGLRLVDNGVKAACEPMQPAQWRWYQMRLRVTSDKIEAWVDDKQIVDQPIPGHNFSVIGDLAPLKPFGFAAQQARRDLRNIRVRVIK